MNNTCAFFKMELDKKRNANINDIRVAFSTYIIIVFTLIVEHLFCCFLRFYCWFHIGSCCQCIYIGHIVNYNWRTVEKSARYRILIKRVCRLSVYVGTKIARQCVLGCHSSGWMLCFSSCTSGKINHNFMHFLLAYSIQISNRKRKFFFRSFAANQRDQSEWRYATRSNYQEESLVY